MSSLCSGIAKYIRIGNLSISPALPVWLHYRARCFGLSGILFVVGFLRNLLIGPPPLQISDVRVIIVRVSRCPNQYLHDCAADVSQELRELLPQKTCLITGANRGLGLGIAINVAALGAHVIMACRYVKLSDVVINILDHVVAHAFLSL